MKMKNMPYVSKTEASKAGSRLATSSSKKTKHLASEELNKYKEEKRK